MDKRRIRVGTITYQRANNYGAALQMFALQKVLERMDTDTWVIDYRSPYMSRPYSMAALKRKGPLRFCLGMAYAAVRLPRMLAFRRFRQELRFTKSVGPSELVDLNQDFDCFIAGSDQVWNDDINDGDPAYFLHFVDKHHKKFSYAASFGFSSLRNEQVQSYRERLVDFSVLSVREASAREIISGLLGRAAHVTLDPTLLLSATEWQDLISKERLVPQKYVLLYHITFSRELVEFAQRFARERGYRLIAVPFPLGKLVWHTPKLSVGPYEWVRLIRDAELVVTDSFHGCAFAINFNKDFVAETTGASTRIHSILDRYELQGRYLSKMVLQAHTAAINWAAVNDKLEEDRSESMQVLKTSLDTL